MDLNIGFLCQKTFRSCREEIAGALQEFCNRWCKRENVEINALNSWKLNSFKIIYGRISSYCNNLELLPPKPKFTFRHLKKGIQEFHRRYVLSCVCYTIVRVCLYVLCGHLLGKG